MRHEDWESNKTTYELENMRLVWQVYLKPGVTDDRGVNYAMEVIGCIDDILASRDECEIPL